MYYKLIFLDCYLTICSFLYYIAIIGGVYNANGSAGQIGFIAMAITLPSIVISFFSGKLFKSANLLRNIYICSGIKIIALLSLYFLFTNPFFLISLIVLNGVLNQLIAVSKQSFDAIQIEPALRTKFNSKKAFLNEIALIIGPALGGLTAAYFSLSNICLILAILSVIPIFFLLSFNNIKRNYEEAVKQKGVSFKENVQYLFSKKVVIFLLLSYSLVVIILEMQTPLTFPFVKEKFNGDNSVTGVFFSVCGIGGVIGALIPIFIKIKNEALAILLLVIFDGLFVFLFTISTNFYLSCAIFTILGLMGSIAIVLVETKVQNDLEEKYRPFAFSIIQLAKSSIGAPLAAGAAAVADHIGAVKVLRGAAYIEIFSGFLFLILFIFFLRNTKNCPKEII